MSDPMWRCHVIVDVAWRLDQRSKTANLVRRSSGTGAQSAGSQVHTSKATHTGESEPHRRPERLDYLPGDGSSGAPVLSEPTNSFVPSGKVTFRPLALLDL